MQSELQAYRKQLEAKLMGKTTELDKLNEEKRRIDAEFDEQVASTKRELDRKLETEKRQIQAQLAKDLAEFESAEERRYERCLR